MLTLRRVYFPVVVTSFLSFVPEAWAQFTAQRTTVALSFAGARFADTEFSVAHRVTWRPQAAGGVAPMIWITTNTQALISRTASAVENCSIQSFSALPVSTQASYSVVAETASATIHDFVATSRPDNQRVMLTEAGGLAALSFNSFSSPIASVLSASYRVVLPGDWSSRGTGTGQLEMLGINAGWTVDRDWVFNGTGTEFEATRTAGTAGVGLRFVLYGAEIPSPGTFVLAGTAMVALTVRRRPRGATRGSR